MTLVTQYAVRLAANQQELATLQQTDPRYNGALLATQRGMLALSTDMWKLLLMCFTLMAVASLVRRRGWKDADHMNIVAGIVVPIGVGLLCLVLVMKLATEVT